MKLMVNISIDTIIQLVSFLMLRNKKESLSPLFYNYLTYYAQIGIPNAIKVNAT